MKLKGKESNNSNIRFCPNRAYDLSIWFTQGGARLIVVIIS